MALETHSIGDRRRHGLGDNVGRKVHLTLPKVKQAPRVGTSVAATFHAAAGYHAAATGMSGAPKLSMPGKGM